MKPFMINIKHRKYAFVIYENIDEFNYGYILRVEDTIYHKHFSTIGDCVANIILTLVGARCITSPRQARRLRKKVEKKSQCNS